MENKNQKQQSLFIPIILVMVVVFIVNFDKASEYLKLFSK